MIILYPGYCVQCCTPQYENMIEVSKDLSPEERMRMLGLSSLKEEKIIELSSLYLNNR